MLKIIKTFNNNIAMVEDDSSSLIVMGKGIAFGKKPGDEIDESKVEKRFQEVKGNTTEQLSRLLSSIPAEVFELSEQIIEDAEKELGVTMDQTIHIGLADHLYEALNRYQNGIVLKNVLLHEIKRFYLKEFTAAMHALDTIYLSTFVRMEEDEAGFIAMHFVNGEGNQENIEESIQIARMTEDIVRIVELSYHIKIDRSSLNCTRFVTHIQYFARRLFASELAVGNKDNDLLYAQVRRQYPEAYACACRVRDYIQKVFHVSISNEEMVYFMLHINRTAERNTTGM
jgi:beta-glucoside operon transcriptional antiterminator